MKTFKITFKDLTNDWVHTFTYTLPINQGFTLDQVLSQIIEGTGWSKDTIRVLGYKRVPNL